MFPADSQGKFLEHKLQYINFYCHAIKNIFEYHIIFIS